MKNASGYSGTPLWRKLGIQADFHLSIVDCPKQYTELVPELPEGVQLLEAMDKTIDLAHWFGTDRDGLSKFLVKARKKLRDDVILWISWPKKSSGVTTSITEESIRELCLPLGWVDVKVCAIDATWSGLKLVVRLTERKS